MLYRAVCLVKASGKVFPSAAYEEQGEAFEDASMAKRDDPTHDVWIEVSYPPIERTDGSFAYPVWHKWRP